MNYLTYGVRAVCVSKSGLETEEILSHLINPNEGIEDDWVDDEFWKENALDILEQFQDEGHIPADIDLEADFDIIITYGVFRVPTAGNRLRAVA